MSNDVSLNSMLESDLVLRFEKKNTDIQVDPHTDTNDDMQI